MLGGQKLIVENNVSRLSDGGLAGSLIMLDQAVRLMVGQAALPVADALRMAATTPAEVIGANHVGSLEPGKQADVVVWDEKLEVVWTMIAGEVAYDREGLLLRPAGV
jgi:N-acetylglucosamine-6-phosphate deacetylase